MKYDLKVYCFLLFLVIIQLVICEINDNFVHGILEEGGYSLLDVADYLNLSLIVTTSGNIYNGTPFNHISQTTADFNESTFIAVCNEDYILASCLKDSLLTKIRISTGEYESLLGYSDYDSITASNSSCCISIYEDIVFIAISQYNYENKIINSFIKLHIGNKNDIIYGPIIINEDKQIFVYPYPYTKSNTSRDISCETIVEKNSNEYRLLCVHENRTNQNLIYAFIINKDFNEIQKEAQIDKSSFEFGFRVYYYDKYYIRCVLRKKMYDLYLNENFEIKKVTVNINNFESFPRLFAYSNNFVFCVRTTYSFYYDGSYEGINYFLIYTFSINYYLIFIYNKHISFLKIYAYYNDKLDYLIFLYQSKDTIEYFILKDNKEMYQINSLSLIYRVKSNDDITLNFSNILQLDKNFGSLTIGNMKTIKSSSEVEYKTFPFDIVKFPVENEQFNLNGSLNNWYEFTLGYVDINENFGRFFNLTGIKLNLRTCAFQCGKCEADYYKCDSCRDTNYLIKSGSNDSNCYPKDQIIENYLSDNNSNEFKKCYYSCKFCSQNEENSNSTNHNCLSCNNGFYASYEFIGNCYEMESEETNKYIIVISADEQSFTRVSTSCSSFERPFIISSTKECVTQCPEATNYYSYNFTYVNFTEQEFNTKLIPQYNLIELITPKYILGNYCYEKCPENSEIESSTSNKCLCKGAWHKDEITEEIICYEENYCMFSKYKYFLNDIKQCTNNCPSDYFQFNFQCYKGGCPSNTNLYHTNKCQSIYKYCYINEHYENICSDDKSIIEVYKYNFNNTLQYLKTCEESINYTTSETKTYLYNGICYLNCPANTKNNDETFKCDCLYFGFYPEEEENYICYNETEKCVDKIPVIDIQKCLNSTNVCIAKGYKIFNNECYSINCPQKTEIKTDINNYFCLCINYYYNKTGELICYDTFDNCEEQGYSYLNPDTNECFSSLEDCFDKGNNYFFNKYCYKENCPSSEDIIPLSSIANSSIKNDFIESFQINDISRICVCDIINKGKNWEYTITSDSKYLQECVNECKIGYEPNKISNKCIESCSNTKHFIFNDECFYEGCPSGTKLEEANGQNCICENYFFIDENQKLICYDSYDDCKNNDLKYYNEELKQCFSSLDNCFENGFNFYFNKVCYKDSCPDGRMILSDIKNITIQDEFMKILIGSNINLQNKICICDIISDINLRWTYEEINEEQNCLYSCPEDKYESEPDPITNKCLDKCDPYSDYLYNDKCYKNGCPSGTKLKEDGTRNCVCDNLYYYEDDKMICCSNESDNINCIIYPPEYYEDPDKCLAVYNNTCYSSCPEGTCLTPNDINLVYCINIRENMTVFNNICISNFQKYIDNIKNMSDNDLYIYISSNILIKAYINENKTIYSNYSYIYLDSCENSLKEYYNLASDDLLYILGVESPSKNKNSSVNVYNYGVFLENGTQLTNLSVCEKEKIIIYLSITNASLIKFEEAKYFYSYGYNIYNESDTFYTDVCSPASIKDNDITLEDRYIDYYISNISFCNESCEFKKIDFDNEKIICNCDTTYNFSKNSDYLGDEISTDKDEDDTSYLDYLLSLINYKIIVCYKLITSSTNYLYNIYFYLGSFITLICIYHMLINNICGINNLYKIIKDNIPDRLKLKEKAKEQIKKEKVHILETNRLEKKLMTINPKYYNNPPINKCNTESKFLNKNQNKTTKKNVIKEKLTSKKNRRKRNKKCSTSNIRNRKKISNESLEPLSLNKFNRKTNYNNTEKLKLDLNFKQNNRLRKYACYLDLVFQNDDSVEKKDLNEIPYTQALRIDKRSIFEIFLYTLANKIEIINIFYYKNPYVHISLSISIYLISFLLDVTFNCFLYTDDVVSEKYHNNGSLEFFTCISLSLASNIISSIITYFIKKLVEYSDLLDIIIRDITLKKYYFINIIKFRKYFKIRLYSFYFIEIIMCLSMTYYITIFCIIYSKTKISIIINYIYGILESMAFSFGLAVIITIMRYLSLKYKCISIYRSSQYLNDKF